MFLFVTFSWAFIRAMDRATILALSTREIADLILVLLKEFCRRCNIPIDSDAVIELRVPKSEFDRLPDLSSASSVSPTSTV